MFRPITHSSFKQKVLATTSRTTETKQTLNFHLKRPVWKSWKGPLRDSVSHHMQTSFCEISQREKGKWDLTLPNCSKYCFTSSTTVLADNPPTNIFFVLVTIWKRREDDKRLGPCESTSEDFKRTGDKEEAQNWKRGNWAMTGCGFRGSGGDWSWGTVWFVECVRVCSGTG